MHKIYCAKKDSFETSGTPQKCFLGVARWSRWKSRDGTPKPIAIKEFQEFYSADVIHRLVEYVNMGVQESHTDTLWFLIYTWCYQWSDVHDCIPVQFTFGAPRQSCFYVLCICKCMCHCSSSIASCYAYSTRKWGDQLYQASSSHPSPLFVLHQAKQRWNWGWLLAFFFFVSEF